MRYHNARKSYKADKSGEALAGLFAAVILTLLFGAYKATRSGKNGKTK